MNKVSRRWPGSPPIASGLGWLMLLLLSACGGGGGGGGDGGGGDSGALQIRYDRSTVALTAQEGAPLGQGAGLIQATAVGGGATESLYVGAEAQGEGLALPIAVDIDTLARSGRITLAPNTGLAPGTYRGTVRLLACKDPQCAAHHVGSPYSVSYTATITPRFKASVTQLAFASFETVQPEAARVQVTLPQGVAGSTAQVEYAAGVTPWLQVTADGQDQLIRPVASLAVGNHGAVLRLEAGPGHAPIRIPVQHRVSAGLLLPGQVDVAIDSRSPASATQGDVAISLASGINAAQWSATSSQPWLRLNAPTGAIGTPLRWQLDGPGWLALANQAAHEATITVSVPGTALEPQTLRLRLSKAMAELRAADTVAVQAGEPGEVLLYGRLLDQLQLPAAQVTSPGFTPLQVTRRSASLISLQLPALPAGSHEISLQSASGLPMPSVRLVVAAGQDRQEVWADSTGLKGPLLWDAVNQAAFTIDLSQQAVLRIEPVATPAGPALVQRSRVLPRLAGIALSPDRRSLIATTEDGQLLALSPQDLGTLGARDLGRTVGPQWPPHLPLLVTGDHWLLATGGSQWAPVLSYDLSRSGVLPLSPTAFTFYSGPWGLVSPNGQRALVTQTAGLSPSPPLLRRDAEDTELRPATAAGAPTYFYHAATDRRGTRWVLDSRRVVDHQLNPLGELPQPLPGGWIALSTAMSRDGSRSYVLAINGAVSASRIFVVDTSGSPGAGQPMPLLGHIDPLLSPSCLSPTTSDSCNGYASRMTLMDDDRTLVLAGDRRVGLVPVPPGLRGGVPPAQAARAGHAWAVGR